MIELELRTRRPFARDHLMAFLAARAVPGVECWDGTRLHRALALPRGHGVAELRPTTQSVNTRLELEDERDLETAIAALRRLCDLDAPSTTIDRSLAADPVLAPFVRATPGLRVAGSVDPFETAVRAVIGQQISVAGGRTLAGRIVASVGAPLVIDGGAQLTHVFPTPQALAEVSPSLLPMPTSRQRTIIELARRVADGRIVLDPLRPRDGLVASLVDVPGIGPWTAGYVCLRGLGDPDVFLPTDLGVKAGLRRLGVDAAYAERWRPWRSYALHHVWAAAGFPFGWPRTRAYDDRRWSAPGAGVSSTNDGTGSGSEGGVRRRAAGGSCVSCGSSL